MTIGEWVTRYGFEAVERLAKARGGRVIYVAKNAPSFAVLRETLGDHHAEELLAERAGPRLEIPLLMTVLREKFRRKQRRQVEMLLREGHKDKSIQRLTMLSRRSIGNIRREMDREEAAAAQAREAARLKRLIA